MRSPLYRGAIRERAAHMREARTCVTCYHQTLDPVWLDMARIHVKTARTFNRHAWRAKRSK